MVVNWMCLFVYLKYKFTTTYLFLFMIIATFERGNLLVTYEYFSVLVVRLCKPVVYKLKILDGGKPEYY